jgi:anti-sigma regulatory factor (Ser/Thr protein kinase)
MTATACVLAGPAFARPTVSSSAAPWPLSGVTGPLPAEETAPRSVRAEARQALALWDLADAVDVIDLVATELATNAIRASAQMRLDGKAPVIRVCLLTDRSVARVEVWDEAPGFPVLREADDEAENGRGLILVNELTGGRWGWTRVAALLPAKCVWAECALTTAQPPDPMATANHSMLPAQDPHERDTHLAPAGEQPRRTAELRLLPGGLHASH